MMRGANESSAVGIGAERSAELQRRDAQLVALGDGFGAVACPLAQRVEPAGIFAGEFDAGGLAVVPG